MKTLGETLKEAREISKLTLRQVEEAANISNAYLSMLENGKIKKPSANVLYKLSSLYRVELDTLLCAAGIITEKQSVKNIGGQLGVLTSDEENQLLDFLKYLRHKK